MDEVLRTGRSAMSETLEMAAAVGGSLDLEGKYLTFVLDKQEFGFGILKVREIIGLVEVTAVPKTPSFVKGVINLRGKVIPVVDLRMKLGIAAGDTTSETCIIVAENIRSDGSKAEVGLMVDGVEEVLSISASDIESPPSLGASVDINYILGMGKSNDRVTILVDIDRVLEDLDDRWKEVTAS